jgi:hypothetical protein
MKEAATEDGGGAEVPHMAAAVSDIRAPGVRVVSRGRAASMHAVIGERERGEKGRKERHGQLLSVK